MSVVLEALEKAQKEGLLVQKRKDAPKKESVILETVPKRKKKHNYRLIILIGVLLIGTLNILILGWWLNDPTPFIKTNRQNMKTIVKAKNTNNSADMQIIESNNIREAIQPANISKSDYQGNTK